jgi:type III secretory pathway component EscV
MAAPRLALVARKPAEEVEHVLEDQTVLQQSLFASRGVLMPRIVYRQSADVGEDEVELRLDDRMISSCPTWLLGYDNPLGAFLSDLEMHASALVVPSLVERYLQSLTESFPELVRSARQVFTLDALTDELAKRVDVGASIRDLRSVLEELLQTVA